MALVVALAPREDNTQNNQTQAVTDGVPIPVRKTISCAVASTVYVRLLISLIISNLINFQPNNLPNSLLITYLIPS